MVKKEFQGLHIDPTVIGQINAQKQGDGIKRKSGGFIVNTGGTIILVFPSIGMIDY